MQRQNHLLRRVLLLFVLATLTACSNAPATTVFDVTIIPSATALTGEDFPTAVVPVLETATVPVQPAATSAPAEPVVTELPTEPPPPTVPVIPTPPPGQIGPTGFPANVNPLTGLVVDDPTVLDRRPMAIKISNYPDCVRPQEGIGQADIVYEHYAEGGTTRFTAVFWTHQPSRVGSVRSARMIDLEIPAMYQSLFAFSGASDGVKKLLDEIDFRDQILSPDFVPGHQGFFRKDMSEINCDLIEHTLFVDPARLREVAATNGIDNRPNVEGMVFNSALPAGGQPGQSVTLPYTASYVYWSYNATDGRYYRVNNGATHIDALTGNPVAAENVVVLFANHVTSDIIEDFVGYNASTGQGGSYSIQIQLWGSGDALLFRDGMVYPVKWLRQERFKPPGLTTANGDLIALKPGVTWFQLVALNSPVEQTGDADWQITPIRPSSTPN